MQVGQREGGRMKGWKEGRGEKEELYRTLFSD